VCPICAREVVPQEGESYGPAFPFCSPACKLIDLSRWLDGAYRIPGPDEDPLGSSEDEAPRRAANGSGNWHGAHEEDE